MASGVHMARSGPLPSPRQGRATAPQLRSRPREPGRPLPKPGPPPARLPRPQQSGESCGIYPGLPGGTPQPGAGGADPADPLGAARSHPPPVHPRAQRAAPLGLRLRDQNMKGMATSHAKPHSEGKECRQLRDGFWKPRVTPFITNSSALLQAPEPLRDYKWSFCL
nr:anther-specific proline-rich protein APG-like [Bubalus bubalis]